MTQPPERPRRARARGAGQRTEPDSVGMVLKNASLAAQFPDLWNLREEVLSTQDILIQAKALILCALPYRRIQDRQITKRAQIGKHASVAVAFTALSDAGLPFGADRALFAWIQTRAFSNGFITFDRLTEFLSAFGLGDDGRNYRLFHERLERLKNLSVSIRVETEDEEFLLNTVPVKAAYTPRSGREVKHRLVEEAGAQLLLIPHRYGFRLDPDFWGYLRANPVPMPLALMREFHDEPKAWDFCQFVLYRCYAARQPSMVPWGMLQEQLASLDQNHRRLKHTLSHALRRMKVVYPDLPVSFLPAPGGLAVAPWRPPRESA